MEKQTKTFTGNKKYPYVVKNVNDWPIYQMSQRRYEFIQEVIEESFNKILAKISTQEELLDELAKTIYQERIRLTLKPWKADAPDENEFWNDIKIELIKITTSSENQKEPSKEAKALLYSIISRYTNEIAGNFDPNIHDFAKVMVPFGFSRLLNTSIGKNFTERVDKQFSIQNRVKLVGEIESLRKLATDHTLILVPTHSSNLDSMLIGWAIHSIGIPPFIYGAGLNLFGIKILAYFMGRLGAYKVDRRKKNTFYLETLKTYSNLAIQSGCHSIFFPGGTRSRSGALEAKLKLGLLGTSMDAQFENFKKAEIQSSTSRKIIICPAVINYHFVLEAPELIKEYLIDIGKEQYLGENDRYSTSFKLVRLMFKLLTESSKIYVSFGAPMDLFGNKLNENGESIDKNGKIVDTKDYFIRDKKLIFDQQRHEQYVKNLGNFITQSYKENCVVFSSNIIAFSVFQILTERFKKLDLYALLLLPKEDRIVSRIELHQKVEKLTAHIFKLNQAQKIRIADHLASRNTDEIIEHALQHLGMYHDMQPLMKNKEGDIQVVEMKLLYFYHNRLTGYGFENII